MGRCRPPVVSQPSAEAAAGEAAPGGSPRSGVFRRVSLVIAGFVVAVLFAAVSTSDSVSLFEEWPSLEFEPRSEQQPPVELFPVELGEEETEVFKIWEVDLPSWLDLVFQIVLFAAAVALVVLAWQRRPQLRWRRRRYGEDFEVLEDLPDLIDTMTADAAAQRRALTRGEPRNAIVACWLRLEAAAAAAGVEPRPADTADEATARILSEYSVDPGAATQLAALYREARFSTHEMDEGDRASAIACLEAIHEGLQREQPSNV